MIRAGDYVRNVRTGEYRLVIEVCPSRNELTFSGSTRWESARDWRSNARVEEWRA